MTPDELQTIYLKVRKVIRSCQTISQWEVARRYAQLFVNQVPPARTNQIGEHLNYVLIQKKQIIRLKYGIGRHR
jgi:predicted amidohydrolase